METIKVHELAKMYGLTNDQMLDFLIGNDIDVASPMSIVEMDSINNVIKKLEIRANLNEHKNKTSLKTIKIIGLFGKYDYSIDFTNDICIWVSENGVGKTTILNIIVAILNADQKTLAEINFRRVEVTIGDRKHIIDKTVIKKEYLNNNIIESFFEEIRRYIPMNHYQRIVEEYKKYGKIRIEYLESLIYKYMYHEMGSYGIEKKWGYILRKLQEMQFGDFADILYEIKSEIVEEPLFYPTYRRIEVSLDKVFLNSSSRGSSELTKYVGFGMDDVKKRIGNLLDKMGQDANNSYIEMNGAIISDLLKSSSINELANSIPQINRHKVEVIIKRIGEERIENIDKLKQFVNGRVENPNEDFLKFYLDKLVKIYDSQKAIDDKLTKFANVCTKYLDGKKIVYDEALLSINVYDSDDEIIDFDDLSSGEKQIVSIFSKVYLDVTTSCIFIIDEPEISLSIEWQKQFLVDIYNSGKVGLLIATTHSPFIFKNEFRDYAMEINIYKEGK